MYAHTSRTCVCTHAHTQAHTCTQKTQQVQHRMMFNHTCTLFALRKETLCCSTSYSSLPGSLSDPLFIGTCVPLPRSCGLAPSMPPGATHSLGVRAPPPWPPPAARAAPAPSPPTLRRPCHTSSRAPPFCQARAQWWCASQGACGARSSLGCVSALAEGAGWSCAAGALAARCCCRVSEH